MLFCSNDWGRKIVVGNLMSLSLEEIWLSPILREIRSRLLQGDRSQSPCNTCNVNGLITGSNSVKVLLRHYLAKEEIAPTAIPSDIDLFG